MNRARCPEPAEEVVPPTDVRDTHASTGRVNRAWRLLWTGFCFAVFGTVAALASLALLLIVRPMPGVGAERKRRWTLRTLQDLSLCYIALMKVGGLMRYSIEHEERLATGGQLIVCNHPSLIDALFIIGYTPGLCCIAKRQLFEHPILAPLVRQAGYLMNDSDTLIEDAAAVLRDGRSLLVFPEGTRNRDDMTLRFQRGAAHIAIASGAKVLPVTIDFAPRSLQKGAPWYAIPARPSTIRVRVHPVRDLLDEMASDVSAADNSPSDPVPVTLVARRFTARLRSFYLEEAHRFADPQSAAS